jgi:hypothetical protein
MQVKIHVSVQKVPFTRLAISGNAESRLCFLLVFLFRKPYKSYIGMSILAASVTAFPDHSGKQVVLYGQTLFSLSLDIVIDNL